MKITMHILGTFLLLAIVGGCKKQGVEVTLTGQISPWNPENEYTIRIINPDHFQNQLIAAIDNEDLPEGKVQYTFTGDLDFKTILEVRVNDTVRCILIPSQGDYLKNPVTGKFYRIEIEEDQGVFAVGVRNIDFQMDFDPEKALDYNPRFIVPVLSVSEDYTSIQGSLDSLPQGSNLYVLTDGANKADRHHFTSKDFDIQTDYKTDYIHMYIESKYGWSQHLKHYEIEKLSLRD